MKDERVKNIEVVISQIHDIHLFWVQGVPIFLPCFLVFLFNLNCSVGVFFGRDYFNVGDKKESVN